MTRPGARVPFGIPSDEATLRSHRLLVQAALGGAHDAVAAWREWSAVFGLDAVGNEEYRILPIVYRNLACFDEPHPDRARLAGIYKQARMRHALAMPRLFELLRALKVRDCRPLPGLELRLGLDSANASIPVDGIELLVPTDRLDDAGSVLASHGWRPVRPLPPVALRPFFALRRFRHPRAGFLVLCWRPFGVDYALGHDSTVWQRTIATGVGGQYLELPDTVDYLLMAGRCNSLLKLCISMARLLPAADINEVAARARTLGLVHPWQRFDLECVNRSVGGLPAGLMAGPLDSGWLSLPDERVPLLRLLLRHWRRYHNCPRHHRPRGFLRYMNRYYRHAWRSSSGNPVL